MATIVAGTDPFTTVYWFLRDLLQDYAPLQDLVKAGNWTDFTHEDDRDPGLDNIQDADAPEIVVLPGPLVGNLWWDHTTTMVTRRYVVGITSADLRLQRAYFPIEWQILRALASTKAADLGLSFVLNVKLQSTDIDRTAPDELARGREGWVGLVNVDVEMTFDHTLDLAASTPTWES